MQSLISDLGSAEGGDRPARCIVQPVRITSRHRGGWEGRTPPLRISQLSLTKIPQSFYLLCSPICSLNRSIAQRPFLLPLSVYLCMWTTISLLEPGVTGPGSTPALFFVCLLPENSKGFKNESAKTCHSYQLMHGVGEIQYVEGSNNV